MWAKVRPWLGWALLGLLLIFILLNLHVTDIRVFLFTIKDIPVAFVILFAAALGAGTMYALPFVRKLKKKEEPPPPASLPPA